MTPKERAAMQQALEALEHKRSCAYKRIDQNPSECTCGVTEALTALREALDHSGEANEMVEFFSKEMKNKISVARAERADQKPVAWYSVKGGFNTCGEGKPLYAAPVRTKDLTDDEIWKIVESFNNLRIGYPEFARAVIAADREKNK